MIRVKALLCKIFSLKISDKDIFDSCISNANIINEPCSACGAINLYSNYSSYQRTMITFSSGHRTEFPIVIPRVKCHCGKTHALILDNLIPYSSYPLRFILFLLWKFSFRTCTVTQFCNKWCTAISTIYKWLHMFIEHYNLWFGSIDEIVSLKADSVKKIEMIESLPREFFNRFRFSFMQKHPFATVSSPMPLSGWF